MSPGNPSSQCQRPVLRCSEPAVCHELPSDSERSLQCGRPLLRRRLRRGDILHRELIRLLPLPPPRPRRSLAYTPRGPLQSTLLRFFPSRLSAPRLGSEREGARRWEGETRERAFPSEKNSRYRERASRSRVRWRTRARRRMTKMMMMMRGARGQCWCLVT